MAHLSLSLRHIRVTSPLLARQYSMREDIRKFREPDKPKKHMLAACQPYFKRVYLQSEEKCTGPAKDTAREINALERILCSEMLEDIKRAEFILFIQYNYTNFQSERVYKNTLTKLGGKWHCLNNRIYTTAFKELNRDDVQSLFIGRNALLTGEVGCLAACVRAFKKMPQFLLLAGIVDDHLYRHGQLQSIAKTTNLDECRANLLSTLYTPSLDLSYYLDSHRDGIEKKDKQEKS